jgi:hypothetical protein
VGDLKELSMEPNITRNRLIALAVGAVGGAILMNSLIGVVAGAVLAFCIYELGAMIDAVSKKW